LKIFTSTLPTSVPLKVSNKKNNFASKKLFSTAKIISLFEKLCSTAYLITCINQFSLISRRLEVFLLHKKHSWLQKVS